MSWRSKSMQKCPPLSETKLVNSIFMMRVSSGLILVLAQLRPWLFTPNHDVYEYSFVLAHLQTHDGGSISTFDLGDVRSGLLISPNGRPCWISRLNSNSNPPVGWNGPVLVATAQIFNLSHRNRGNQHRRSSSASKAMGTLCYDQTGRGFVYKPSAVVVTWSTKRATETAASIRAMRATANSNMAAAKR